VNCHLLSAGHFIALANTSRQLAPSFEWQLVARGDGIGMGIGMLVLAKSGAHQMTTPDYRWPLCDCLCWLLASSLPGQGVRHCFN